RRDQRLGEQADILLFVPGEVANHHLLLRQKPLQVTRQRDAIVERMRLVGDEPDVARDIVLAEHLRAGGARYAIADDNVLLADLSSQLLFPFVPSAVACIARPSPLPPP